VKQPIFICHECHEQIFSGEPCIWERKEEIPWIVLFHVPCYERHRHRRELTVFFYSVEGGNFTMQIFSNDTKGLLLALAESAKGVAIALSKGPFAIAVQDPSNTCTFTPGSADQTTPASFVPNGSGAVGTVTVVVTDNSVTPPLVSAPASFQVVAPAPPPPPVPDTLVASFVPAP
jgi:hypothetical protein